MWNSIAILANFNVRCIGALQRHFAHIGDTVCLCYYHGVCCSKGQSIVENHPKRCTTHRAISNEIFIIVLFPKIIKNVIAKRMANGCLDYSGVML